MSSRLRHIARALGLLAVAAALAGAAVFGWRWAQAIELVGIEVSGAVHSDVAHVLALAAVPDTVRLFGVDARLVADRVERAQWVERAQVRRRLDGRLGIALQERRPAALLLDGQGEAVAFLDAAGYVLPLTTSARRAGYDVPLITGRLPRLLPTQPVDDPALRRLLAALPAPGSLGDALISGFERRPNGEFVLRTTPTPGGEALVVRLGRANFGRSFRRLEAFWQQVVLAEPEQPIRRVDLRFDGQIITSDLP